MDAFLEELYETMPELKAGLEKYEAAYKEYVALLEIAYQRLYENRRRKTLRTNFGHTDHHLNRSRTAARRVSDDGSVASVSD